jgi:FlgD Ig-like domain
MKSILAFFISCFLISGVSAQTNAGTILQITLDKKQMQGTCVLAGVDTVYMHSGLGWSNTDSIWQSIVGDWGINDGKGMMTNMGDSVFSICFNVREYYTNLADPDSTHPGGVGSGPMPQGATPYNIGAVFRTASCPVSSITGKPECTADKTGKDPTCENVYILRIDDTTQMNIQDNNGNPFPPLTARYITVCAGYTDGIENIATGISELMTFPVPFTDMVNIKFTLTGAMQPKAEIFDMLGQKVADLSSSMSNGPNWLTWKGKDLSGKPVAPGVYTYKISNNNGSYKGKIIKQ